MPHSRNRLLARLGVSDIDRFRPYLVVTELHHGEVLAESHQTVNKVSSRIRVSSPVSSI